MPLKRTNLYDAPPAVGIFGDRNNVGLLFELQRAFERRSNGDGYSRVARQRGNPRVRRNHQNVHDWRGRIVQIAPARLK